MRKNLSLIITALISIVFIGFGIFNPEKLGEGAAVALSFISDNFGWLYILAAPLFLFLSVILALSKYGKIRLGKDTDRPEFSTLSWIAMLYSAGFAIGLFFWGVAQPVMVYTAPPMGEGYTEAAADFGMRYSFFIWGLLNWGFYTIGGLVMAYFQYRKDTPPLVNYAFQPLLGDRIHGLIGKLIVVLTIIATLFGLITSLGQGVRQIGAGLEMTWGISNTKVMQISLIIILTVVFTISAVTGIKRGIRVLSNINIILASIIMLLIFFLGPTQHILNTFVSSTGDHLANLIKDSFWMGPFGGEETAAWLENWTIFYWGWGISFAAFVGFFIARISKGRTIREYVLGAIIIPSIGTIFWFSVFGGSALHLIHNLGHHELAESVNNDVSAALFEFFQNFPMSGFIASLTIFSLIIFFVTSADSNVYVLGMFSEENENPSNKIKVFWATIIAGISIVLLLSGGLGPLQSVAVVAGLPFCVVLLLMCYSFLKALRQEDAILSASENRIAHQQVSENLTFKS